MSENTNNVVVENTNTEISNNIPKSATCLTLPVANESPIVSERQIDNLRYLSTASANVKIISSNSGKTSPTKVKIIPMDLKESAR